MAIIKTYPLKSNYYGLDRLILSDMQPDAQGVVHGETKSLTLANLRSFIGTGSDAFTLVVDRTSGASTFDTNTKILNIPNYSGDTYTLQAEDKSNNSVPLKLDAAAGSDSTVNFTEGANVTLTKNSATEITISATGGNAGVSSITNTFGTYISGTNNTAATGAVGLGTINLTAVDGTSDSTTRFLSKDNTWDVPTYSAPGGSNNYFQYNKNGSFEGSSFLSLGSADDIVIGAVSTELGKLVVSGSETASGTIKIEGANTQNGVTFSVQTGVSSVYSVIFPDTGPGGNNKILESNSSGELAWINTPSGGSYTLPLAANGTRGGIQIGYAQNAKNYPVVLSSEKAYVNVPWTDTVYSLPEATSTVRGGIELFSNTAQSTAANTITTTASRTYGIQLNADGQAVVNVPWTGGGTTYTAGTGITINSGNEIINTDLGSSQFIYKNFTATSGGTATANSNNDTLTIAAGTGITTTRSSDTITIAATGSGGYDDGFIPLDIYQTTSDVGGNSSEFAYIRQTQSYNSSTINTVSFFVSSVGTGAEIRFGLFDSANVKNGTGTCRAIAEKTSGLTAGTINTMTLSDGEGGTVNYTCVPGKNIVLFWTFKNCTIAGAAALSNSGLGVQDISYVTIPTVDDPLSTTKTAIGSGANDKVIACHFYKT